MCTRFVSWFLYGFICEFTLLDVRGRLFIFRLSFTSCLVSLISRGFICLLQVSILSNVRGRLLVIPPFLYICIIILASRGFYCYCLFYAWGSAIAIPCLGGIAISLSLALHVLSLKFYGVISPFQLRYAVFGPMPT